MVDGSENEIPRRGEFHSPACMGTGKIEQKGRALRVYVCITDAVNLRGARRGRGNKLSVVVN